MDTSHTNLPYSSKTRYSKNIMRFGRPVCKGNIDLLGSFIQLCYEVSHTE